MRGIFFRHVLRDIAQATVGMLLVLVVVLFTWQLAFVLGRAADGQLPGALVLQLVALTLRANLTVILPLAVLLGAILALGRLYHDSEIAAAQACGVGTRTLYGAAAITICAAAAIAAWVAFADGPVATRQVVTLRTEALRTAVTRGLAAGQFRSLGHDTTVYFRAADADGTLRDVFIQRDLQASQGGRMQIVLADRASYAVSADGNHYLIHLGDGRSYEGAPGSGDWRITRFRQQAIRLPTPQATLPGRPRTDALPTSELLASSGPRVSAELHWRMALVLEVIVLGLLAVPLARLRPTQGRHARVPWAVLLFAAYTGLLTAGRAMLERGDLPAVLGLWWVHATIVMLGILLLKTPQWIAAMRRAAARRPASGLA